MALTFDSEIRELVKSPEAVEICKKYGMDEDQIKALEEELNAAGL